MAEVTIKFELCDDGSIKIFNNKELVLEKTGSSQMEITGKEIFDSLKFDVNNEYILEDLEENNNQDLKNEYEAMKKIHEFYSGLIDSINKLEHTHETLAYEISLETDAD